jgi:hypothetical protein
VLGNFLPMPIARTFELDELWCFLRLVCAGVETWGAALRRLTFSSPMLPVALH